MRLLALLAAPLLALPFPAAPSWAGPQAGDRPGEEQRPLPPDLEVPPAPALDWEAERATFALPPGYRVELVAAEPLVRDPVCVAWDEAGRLWVCEMSSYMTDVDGSREGEPLGTIAVLEDTDGDGRMDERTVFLDGLVLPRALRPIAGGLLAITPPEMIFVRDVDGDGRGDGEADERVVVATGMGGLKSPEHAVNGLLPGLDGWILCANHPWRYRPPREPGGEWERQRTNGGGQWGIAIDDLGRAFFNTNPDPLRGDRYGSHYAVRNPNHGRAAGVNERWASDTRVWPARITPGVNRGYQPKVLAEDFRLATFTAACGPWIHRGDGLAPQDRGRAFVCEPAGNLLKRFDLSEHPDGRLEATNVVEGDEFLTSTDERFRPVSLAGDPRGGLLVVDMYRGVIQHKIFVTSFLREQILERGLEQPVGYGRIWRIVHDEAEPRTGPDLVEASWTELVACLAHPNGWWRDRAHRLLIDEGAEDPDALELLREAARTSPSWLARFHAVHALAAMGRVTEELALEFLADGDARVQHAAVRAAEPFLARPRVLGRAVELARGAAPGSRLRHQVLLSLGEPAAAASDVALADLLTEDASTALVRSAAISGLHGRESRLLAELLARGTWSAEAPGRADLLRLLARAVGREGRTDGLDQVLTWLAARPVQMAWQADALAAGLLEARPRGPDGLRTYLRLPEEPSALEGLTRAAGRGREPVAELLAALAWPGREGVELPEVRPLTSEEEQRFARGGELFSTGCAQCHQTSGLGEEGKAPPLRHSPFVLGDPDRLIKIVAYGMAGPVEVDGRTWNMEMPAYVAGDGDLAALLTYVRREWGHGAEPITAEDVRALRVSVGERALPFTVEELAEAPSTPEPGDPR